MDHSERAMDCFGVSASTGTVRWTLERSRHPRSLCRISALNGPARHPSTPLRERSNSRRLPPSAQRTSSGRSSTLSALEAPAAVALPPSSLEPLAFAFQSRSRPLLVRQHVRDWFPRLRHIRRIVLPEQRSQSGRNLILRYRRNAGTLSQRRRIRPKKCHPDVFRVRILCAVIFPLVMPRLPASVVRRKNQRRAPAVFRHGLHRLPQDPHVVIRAMRGVQIFLVVAYMRPIVRLAQREVKNPRLFLF